MFLTGTLLSFSHLLVTEEKNIHDVLDDYWRYLYQKHSSVMRVAILLALATGLSLLTNVLPWFLSISLMIPLIRVAVTPARTTKAGEWNPMNDKGTFASKVSASPDTVHMITCTATRTVV